MDVLLIGAGGAGMVIARHLASSTGVDSLIVGDIDLARAESVARKCGRKVKAIRLDAGNSREVSSALRKKGMVINAALPRYNTTVMNAALRTRAKYIDLALQDPVGQYAADDVWRKKGNTAVIGLGEDPGMSNIFAMYAANRMDRVKSVQIRDGETAISSRHPFVCLFSPATFLTETIEEPVIFRNGRLRHIGKFSDREMYDFPGGMGKLPVYSVRHEEVYSLPESIGKGIRNADFKLALTDDTMKYLEVLNTMGMLSEKKIAVNGSRIKPIDLTLKLIPQPAQLGEDITGKAIILVDVEGSVKGRKTNHRLYATMDHEECYARYGVTATSYLTGTGAAAGALMMIEDGTVRAGIHPPEHLNPDSYLEKLASLGVKVVQKLS